MKLPLIRSNDQNWMRGWKCPRTLKKVALHQFRNEISGVRKLSNIAWSIWSRMERGTGKVVENSLGKSDSSSFRVASLLSKYYSGTSSPNNATQYQWSLITL